VLDGRDIGTIVCPDADVKIYVTATVEERAKRRHKELEGRGETPVYDDVLEDIRKRDSRDVGRPVAPLWPAKDAIQLDTTKLDPDEAYKAALGIIKERMAVLSVSK
jgi:CMP/dCMP kinase